MYARKETTNPYPRKGCVMIAERVGKIADGKRKIPPEVFLEISRFLEKNGGKNSIMEPAQIGQILRNPEGIAYICRNDTDDKIAGCIYSVPLRAVNPKVFEQDRDLKERDGCQYFEGPFLDSTHATPEHIVSLFQALIGAAEDEPKTRLCGHVNDQTAMLFVKNLSAQVVRKIPKWAGSDETISYIEINLKPSVSGVKMAAHASTPA